MQDDAQAHKMGSNTGIYKATIVSWAVAVAGMTGFVSTNVLSFLPGAVCSFGSFLS